MDHLETCIALAERVPRPGLVEQGLGEAEKLVEASRLLTGVVSSVLPGGCVP